MPAFLQRRADATRQWFLTLGQMFRMIWDAHRRYCCALLALDLCKGLFPLATAWLSKLIFDLLAAMYRQDPQDVWSRLLLLLGAQALLGILSQSAQSVHSFVNAELGRRLMLDVQLRIFRKTSSLTGLGPFEDPAFADNLQIASGNATSGALQVLSAWTSLVRNTVILASFIVTLVLFSPLLAAMVLAAAVPHLLVQLKLGRKRLYLAVDSSAPQRRAGYYGSMLYTPLYAKEVRLFGLSEFFLDLFGQTTRQVHQAQRELQVKTLKWECALNLLVNVVSAAAFVLVVARAFHQQLGLGDIVLYTSALSNTQLSLSGLAMAFSQISETVLFYGRYNQLMALAQPVAVPSDPRPVAELRRGIELRNVWFRYRDDLPWVLEGADLFIPAGQCCALVGLNGAGKTTLVKLLTRLYDPTDGHILWDGTDIRQMDPEQLRKQIGVVFQDFVRYDLSVRDNIGIGDIERRECMAAVESAARKAGIHDAAERLPMRYDTLLSRWFGDGAANAELSGGQWQKLAIARMFMRQAGFVILDEPTASLDAQAEFDLYQHFRELMKDRTCLLITHRFSTVRLADSVAVLEDGKVSTVGTHSDLLGRHGTYAQLYQMQASCYQ